MADRHVKDTWSVFKIMGEFVEGFETLRSVWPSVSIFGGSRVAEDSRYYGDAVQIAQGLSKAGFSIITGGGPGLMEAANRGARVAGGSSIGLNIKLASEPDDNKYADTVINFNYFFARKVMFVKYACGIVGMPGGFGTLDEIFEALTLVQTRKIKSLPVVLYGREYWGGLIEWIETSLVREGLISAGDLELFSVTDDPDEVTEIIKSYFDRVQPGCNGEPGDGRNVL
jgi:uncharacterized protein (TIGR00730 family)